MKHPEAERQDFVPNDGKFFAATRDEPEVLAPTTPTTASCSTCLVSIVQIDGQWWPSDLSETPRHSPPHRHDPSPAASSGAPAGSPSGTGVEGESNG